ncbi:hypothetical protein CWC20_19940 [Pseudoalteromonas aurantia]|uniref:Integrase catalytic domain-containing protein n=1 Tax=Pseudoalteromonas aurantia TaxID=43654 RepID=A0A5S3V2M5_9GAMM|nr:hypothetical protein CWC19_18480 [Pseudoalteromonas aurantia]TMO70058.1 hypothetical protein CWC20_19940 [Pseudoalteromonas aurantia]
MELWRQGQYRRCRCVNAVDERFFVSLKHDWLLKIPQPTREHMRNDVMAYMRYYNLARLHTANGELSPAEYEQTSLRKCPQLVAQNSMFIPGMRDRYTCVLMKVHEISSLSD